MVSGNQYEFFKRTELVLSSGFTSLSFAQLVSINCGGVGNVKSVTANTATTVNLLEKNTNRKEAIITNESSQPLYLKYGSTASITSYTLKLLENEVAVIDTYFGIIDGIWSGTTTGNARVTETT